MIHALQLEIERLTRVQAKALGEAISNPMKEKEVKELDARHLQIVELLQQLRLLEKRISGHPYL